MFEAMLAEIAAEFQFLTYRAVDSELPESVDSCDGYITTGSRHGVNDELHWIAQLEEFIAAVARSEKKYAGICFGHQLVAKALGGQVADLGWAIGMSSNRIDIEKPWMNPFQGHPEFSSAYSRALMGKRADIIPVARIREGRTSLQAVADDRLMMRWITNFFNGTSRQSE